MNVSTLQENFLTDFFKKMFRKREKEALSDFEKIPGIAAKIKKARQGMKDLEKSMNKSGLVWRPEKGGWVDKKTGKRRV
tara:strand:- start:431 stop:667 length:237 start_codon:yes stop_codon:yes gene_type:complete